MVDEVQAARIAARLANPHVPAKHLPRAAPGLVFAETARGELLNLALDMKPELVVHLLLDGPAPEEGAYTNSKIVQHHPDP